MAEAEKEKNRTEEAIFVFQLLFCSLAQYGSIHHAPGAVMALRVLTLPHSGLCSGFVDLNDQRRFEKVMEILKQLQRDMKCIMLHTNICK